MNTKTTRLRAAMSFSKVPDPQFLLRAEAVDAGMNGNPRFPAPPVDLAVFKAGVANYSAAIIAALDGGKKALAERQSQRESVLTMMRPLAIYVEVVANGDLAAFLTSGFQVVNTIRSAAQPLAPATIRKIDYGVVGQLLVSLAGVPKAVTYDVRRAPLINGISGTWTTQVVTRIKSATAFDGLTPGTTYAFQVRALGHAGYTDWSDSVTKMCT